MKRFLWILTIVLSLSLLWGCGNTDNSSDGGEHTHSFVDGVCSCGETAPSGDSSHTHKFVSGKCSCGALECRVRLLASEGAEVVGSAQISVAKGECAVYTVKLNEGYIFKGVESSGVALEAEYDRDTRILKVYGISGNQNLAFLTEKVDYDTAAEYEFYFAGMKGDTASLPNGTYKAGTEITLTAGITEMVFDGWSFGGTLDSGGVLISTSRVTTFALSEEFTAGGMCYVFANYAARGTLKYDPNGGVINYSSQNLSAKTYYGVSGGEDMATVTFDTKWFEEVGAPYTFWDDGSFTREGYILKEYNTRPDGLGTGYSLGSKYPMDEGTVLYCIWAKDTSHADFNYRDIELPLPEGANAAYAPNWIKNGIIITEYVGNDETVVIPEMIDGKYVIAIGARAFVDKSIKELVVGRRVAKIEDGAFISCEYLTTFYYPDSIAYISNEAFDDATYSSFTNFYVNATMAPRFSKSEGGSFAKKFARLIANYDKNRIIVISGSSSYCGLSVEYLEALINNEDYCVVNFGTTRTTQIYMYLEAMSEYAHEGDIILYAPENSIYEMGEPRLYWKTLRDLEGMYNIFRYVDISGYENVFGAFAEFNVGTAPDAYDELKSGRYQRSFGEYGDIVNSSSFNEYGELITNAMNTYLKEENYKAVYEVTLNKRFKSILEGEFSTAKPEEEPWQTSEKWCSADEEIYLRNLNRAIDSAKSSGAAVYFTFAPVDYDALAKEAKADLANWCDAYEAFISESYNFDGLLGETEDYIFAHKYFYNNAYHTNNYGRVYRTYQMYLDLCPLLGIETPFKVLDRAFTIEGCQYEWGAVDGPLTPYLP